MFMFWMNRVVLPFPALGYLCAAGLTYLFVDAALLNEFNLVVALWIAFALAVLVYVLRMFVMTFGPYTVKFDAESIAFPARVDASTYRWWRQELRDTPWRNFAAQEFEFKVSRDGVYAVVRLPMLQDTIVHYSIDQIASIGLRNRGLTELEVNVVIIGLQEPFIVRAQTIGWPFSSRDRISKAIRDLLPERVV